MNSALPTQIVEALSHQQLLPFLMKVFETLHPGEPPLVPAWYLKAMCYRLEKIERGETTPLSIAVPPRHLKSITTAVAFSAWMLGHKPHLPRVRPWANWSSGSDRPGAASCTPNHSRQPCRAEGRHAFPSGNPGAGRRCRPRCRLMFASKSPSHNPTSSGAKLGSSTKWRR